ncbi:D-alanyl-D-alanine carboxypeptidase family protein [Magnetospira sp. QH-2]|uniref:D-alanyl-D-alanine carboxypeptidase family protein n=1 Tax=Magnetospira sp. (strain QH-2) TaxID=1288970 RepID=UPI000AC3CFA8|nr:D-alanyl-D-alanine carboxypeptidase family protein [Magnetospira sp. QH-2]
MGMSTSATLRNLVFGLAAFALLWTPRAQAIETKAKQAILLDFNTGAVLFEKEPDTRMAPSSMSKLMTVFMLLEALKDGRLSLEDTFPVSKKAWKMGGSKMFVEVDTRVKVEDLLRGIIVQSGNDACIVVAESLGGSESAFAQLLTAKAHDLGMVNSNFMNASGWPHKEHWSTARDLSILARETIASFPEYYHYYSERSFTFNKIRQGNRNPLLFKEMGADGLKTGHTEAGGYGLTASAQRNGRRLIMVVNGLKSVRARASEAERLMEWGFREFGNYDLFRAGDTVLEAPVWLGEAGQVPLIIEEDLIITLKRTARKKMKVTVSYEEPIPAPVVKGTRLATLHISAPESEVHEIPLVAGENVPLLGPLGRLVAAVNYLIWGGNG